MNCYTVTNQRVHVGIALSWHDNVEAFALHLGIKVPKGGGHENTVTLDPSSPASHVLVAGGIHLMRTTTLLNKKDEFCFTKARPGLKPDITDERALVFLDYKSKTQQAGYRPSTYSSIPVQGFEVLQPGKLYRVQALVVLEPDQHIGYSDNVHSGYTVAYSFPPQRNRFPQLSCIPSRQFRNRQSTDVTVV